MLVVKIYNGDKAEDILATVKMNQALELDEEDMVNIERVIRFHSDWTSYELNILDWSIPYKNTINKS